MKILKLPASDPQKFGPKRAKSKKQRELERQGQLNLFSGRVLQLHPLSTFEEALMLDERGVTEKARERYLAAVEEGDSPADAYCNLGILESDNGKTAKAINYLTLCLKHDPRHCEAHFNLANIYSDAGNYELARLHYEISIEIDTGFSDSYLNLALTLLMTRQYEEAVRILNEYCRITPLEADGPARELLKNLKNLI